MKELVFFLEEPSMEEMLKGLLPRIELKTQKVTYLVFEGKSDLEKRLERKLRAYNNPEAFFVIMRDQDSGDCKRIKQNILEKCKSADKPVLVRIVCRQLESWYIADLLAVEKGLQVTGLCQKQNKAKYRDPDILVNAGEELTRLVPAYQKVGGSRSIGPHLDIENTRSHSFSIFIQGLKRLAS